MLTPFPNGPKHVYLGTESYYLAELADDTYVCSSGIDDTTGFMNSACLNSIGTYTDFQTLTTVSDTVTSCVDLKRDFCVRPVEIRDTKEESTFTEMCKYVDGEMCAPISPDQDIDRPVDDNNRSPNVNLWYIGDIEYTVGYNYECNESKDLISSDYYNVLCGQEDGYSNGDIVYCTMETYDSTTTYILDSTNHIASCNIVTCDKMHKDWCTDGVDLYTLDGAGEVAFVDLCIHDGGDGCKAQSKPTAEFHTPQNVDHSIGNWWFVGSAEYNNTTTYLCDDNQNVGTINKPYINILCDLGGSGSITQHDDVICTEPDKKLTSDQEVYKLNKFTSNREVDCSPVDCASLPTDLCSQAIDIYTDDGSKAVYVDTCISDGDSGCKTKDPVEFHPPADDSASLAGWWFVGSASFDRSTAYDCDSDQDVGTEDYPYINVLCDPSFGSVVTTDSIQCDTNLAAKTFFIASQGFGDVNMVDCSPTDCASLPVAMCTKAIDIYTDDGTNAVYADTCVADTDSCKTRDPVEFHPPDDDSASLAGWWFVGNASYDRSTAYPCDDDQDVGTGGNTYINILCDPSYSGAVVQTDSIQCSGVVSQNAFADITVVDCSPTDCDSLPVSMCTQAIDIYVENNKSADYTDTCIMSYNGRKCHSKRVTTSTTNSTESKSAACMVSSIAVAAGISFLL